jgi:hypothetical protein
MPDYSYCQLLDDYVLTYVPESGYHISLSERNACYDGIV